MKTTDTDPKTPAAERTSRMIPQPESGIELIYNERVRHDTGELYDAASDAQHRKGELAYAGASYAILAASQSVMPGRDVVTIAPPTQWPWPGRKWKPGNSRIHNLVRAGALIAAEIDRLIAAGEPLPVAVVAAVPANAEGKTPTDLALNPPGER